MPPSIDLDIGTDGATVILSKVRPIAAPYLNHAALENAVRRLEPLSGTIALCDASRHAR